LSNFSKRFDTGYRQYIANFEGDFDNDDDDDDDLEGAFRTLLVDYKDDNSSEEKLINSLVPSFFTLVESFFLTKSLAVSCTIPYVKTLADNLNN
jgi:hypothetical protein